MMRVVLLALLATVASVRPHTANVSTPAARLSPLQPRRRVLRGADESASPDAPPAELPAAFTHATLASPLIYIHIAKTGGMSLRKALYSSVFGWVRIVTNHRATTVSPVRHPMPHVKQPQRGDAHPAHEHEGDLHTRRSSEPSVH